MKYLLGLAISLILTMNGINTLLANDLMSGIYPFSCNDQSFVIIEDNDTWSIANSTVDVSATENGWRIDDKDKSSVGYLRETRRGTWFLDWLSSDGHEQLDCIDLFSATDQVVELVKQKINQNITDKNVRLEDELANLKAANQENKVKRLDAENEVVSLSAKIESLEKQLEIKTSQANYVVEARKRDRADLGEARDRIAAMTAEVTSISSELEIKKNQVVYFSTGWDKEVIKLREARTEIVALKAEITALSSKLEGQKKAIQNLRYALDQSENDLRAVNEKNKRIQTDPSGLRFLRELKGMGPSERNKAMIESKFGGPVIARTGQLGQCISALRNKALLSDDCEIILVDFLLDPDAYKSVLNWKSTPWGTKLQLDCLPLSVTERFWVKSGKSFHYQDGYLSLIKSPRRSGIYSNI